MRPEDIDRAEFRTDYEFTARYAGCHHAPARSPGAWIAFREGDYLKGDYTFLMNRGSDATVALYNLDDTRYGLWARRLRAGASTTLTMNESFTSSLVGNTGVNVRVRYKDNGNGSFTVAAFGKSFTGQKSGGGGWKVAEFTTSVSANAPQIEIRAVGDDLVLHMVEVLRGTSGQVRVPGGPRNAVPLSSTRTVVRVFDMRGRMLMRLVGETAPEQIAQRIRQRQGAGCYLLTRASNGTERQWISRVILEE
jgi:hypothetical protein